MSLFERIQLICAQRGTSFFAVEKACGLSNGAINKWKTTSPSIDKIAKLANFLNVSVDFLCSGVEAVKNVSGGIELSSDEVDLISRYRRLNSRDKFVVSEDIDKKLECTFTNAPKAESSTLHSGGGNTEKSEEDGAIA